MTTKRSATGIAKALVHEWVWAGLIILFFTTLWLTTRHLPG